MNKSIFRFRDYSLSAKLITAFLAVTLIPIAGLAYYNNIRESQSLTDAATQSLTSSALEGAGEVDRYIEQTLNSVRTDAKLHSLRQYLLLSPGERVGSERETAVIEDLNTISHRDEAFITSVSLFDINGANVADTVPTEVGEDSSDKIFLTETINTQSPYVSPAYLEDGTLTLSFSAPVNDEAGNLVGVLRLRYKAEVLQDLVTGHVNDFGAESAFAVLLDENNIRLGDSDRPDQILKTVAPLSAEKLAQLQADLRLPPGTVEELSTNFPSTQKALENIDTQPVFSAQFHQGANSSEVEKTVALRLASRPWVFVFGQNEAVFLAPLQTTTRNNTIIAVVVAALVAVIGYFISLVISRPIVNLTAVAGQIAAGNVDVQAKVESQDEIGTLAGSFNTMTAQLRDFIATLEQRVAARTKDLATVAEVGMATATILESKRLLQEVVDLTKERFNLYHSHIYLLDEARENLVLASGAGEPGRQMLAKGLSIPLSREQSLVARAARERKGVTVNDVTQAPDFLPNPLLPNTRSELAVPLIAGGTVLGVFDIQSDIVGRFGESDINIQTTLAAQLATSLQNVRSFEQSKAQADLESLVNTIGQKIQRTTSVEDTLQTAIREIGLALGASRVSARIAGRQVDKNNGSQN